MLFAVQVVYLVRHCEYSKQLKIVRLVFFVINFLFARISVKMIVGPAPFVFVCKFQAFAWVTLVTSISSVKTKNPPKIVGPSWLGAPPR